MSRRGSRRGAGRCLLRRVHLWVGLALSLLLFVLAVTGGALVYKEAYWRLVYPELRAPARDLTAGDHAAAIAAARARFGPRLRSIKLPEPGVPAYHLYLDDGEAFLAAGASHGVIDEWRPYERLMPLLFDLHAHLMAGEAGERVGGVVALLGAVLSTTGLLLWWPARRRFRVAHLVPTGLSRHRLLPGHRDLGALASPVLLLLLLTGAGLVFHETARTLLNAAFGDRAPAAASPAAGAEPALATADAAIVERAQAAFPDARIVFYYPPGPGGSVHGFRVKQPCEVHPNGRSYVYLDARGRVTRTVDACALPPGERGAHALYPLHAGKVGGAAYKLLAFLGAAALAALSLTGAVSYLAHLRRMSAAPARHAVAPGAPRRRRPRRQRTAKG